MTAAERTEYERETTRFIDDWNVTTRLAEARALLVAGFDLTPGDDDMDDVERELESVECWKSPDSSPDQGEQAP